MHVLIAPFILALGLGFAGTAGGALQTEIQNAESPSPALLSPACRAAAKGSPKVKQALEAMSVRPSAGAYDRLGAAFAAEKLAGCAVQSYREAIRLDPGLWVTRYNLALALISQDENQKAVEELRQLIGQNSEFFPAYGALGLALQNLGKPDEAAAAYRDALRLNPEFAEGALSLAQILHAQKKYPAAIHYLQQALNSSPARELLYQMLLSLGAAYVSNGRGDEALETLERLVKEFPQSSEAYVNLGALLIELLRYQQAEAAFDRALQLDPSNQLTRLSLGKAMLEAGHNEAAIPVLNAYLETTPDDSEVYHALGEAFRKVGKTDQAIQAFTTAARLNPQNYRTRLKLGFILARSGRLDQAIPELEAARRLNPDAPEPSYELSLIYRKKNMAPQAEAELRHFQEAKRRAWRSEEAQTFVREGNYLLASGDAPGAITAYRQALRVNPHDAGAHYNLAQALGTLGDRTGQKAELLKTLDVDPNRVEARNQLGTLLLEEGRWTEAEREFKRAIDTAPEFAEARNNLGAVYARQGKLDEAIAQFQEATKFDPRSSRASLNWGLVLAQQGNFTKAEEKLNRAKELSPDSPDIYTALGMVAVESGRPDDARRLFEKALALKPGSAEAMRGLEALKQVPGHAPSNTSARVAPN